MGYRIPFGSIVTFPVSEEIQYLLNWLPDCGQQEREIVIDVISMAYLAAFCVLFPYSRIQINKLNEVSIRLAQTLSTISTSRLIDQINLRSHVHHCQDSLIAEIHAATEKIFENACEQLKQTFDPNNREPYSNGVSGMYDIRIADMANGYLIKAVFHEKHTLPAQSPNPIRRLGIVL